MLPAEACHMLGYDLGFRMKLLKSMYGLADAPRLWWREATDRLLACGFRAHPLDPCLFLSYAETKTGRTLDGALCMHVDDLMGTGDINGKTPGGFADKLKKLQQSFSFRTWEEGP